MTTKTKTKTKTPKRPALEQADRIVSDAYDAIEDMTGMTMKDFNLMARMVDRVDLMATAIDMIYPDIDETVEGIFDCVKEGWVENVYEGIGEAHVLMEQHLPETVAGERWRKRKAEGKDMTRELMLDYEDDRIHTDLAAVALAHAIRSVVDDFAKSKERDHGQG